MKRRTETIRNNSARKHIRFLFFIALIVIITQPVLALNFSIRTQENTNEIISNSGECYGLIIPFILGYNQPSTSVQQSLTNMINDLLRLNLSIFQAASNFSSLTGTINDERSEIRFFDTGAIVIPFTGDTSIDTLLLNIASDYESGSEIESYYPVEIYFLLQPLSINVYPLKYAKIAYHFGVNIAHWCLFQYLEILSAGGFFDNILLFDDEIKEKLTNENFNLFIWSAARGDNLKSTIQSSVNPDICDTVRRFVRNGGGFVGSCYGAYAASSGIFFPMLFMQSYGFLSLTSSSVIPMSQCVAYITTQLQNMSHPVSYGLNKTYSSFLWEGPVFSQRFMNNNTQSLALLDSVDIAFWTMKKEPLPWFEEKFIDFFINKPIWLSSVYGTGKIVVFGDHPEFNLPNRNDRLIHNAVFYTTADKKTMRNIDCSWPFSDVRIWFLLTHNLTLPTSPIVFSTIRNMTDSLHLLCKNIDECSTNVFIHAGKLSDEGKDDQLLKRSRFYQDSYQAWITKFSEALTKLEQVYNVSKQIASIAVNVSCWQNRTIVQLKNSYNTSLLVYGIYSALDNKIRNYIGSPIEKIQILHLFNTLDAQYRKCYNDLLQLWESTIKLYRNCWYFYEHEVIMAHAFGSYAGNLAAVQKKTSYHATHNRGDILYVDDDAWVGGNGSVTSPYLCIQDAIDASCDGDTIIVRSGMYHEHLFIGKKINLIGENKNTTIIDGDKTTYSIIWVSSSEVTIRNFTIQNSSTNQYSCGIVIYSSFNRILENIFTRNCIGLGFAPNSCDNLIQQNIFFNNIFMGLSLDEPSDRNNTITNNTFMNNSVYGLYLENTQNKIQGNSFLNDGVTIKASPYAILPEIINNTVNNKPLVCYKNLTNFSIINAGEIILSNCQNGTIENLYLTNTDVGVSIFNSSAIRIRNSTVSDNLVGIILHGSTNIVIYDNVVRRNKWSGIWFFKSHQSQILHNVVSQNDDGVYLCSSTSNDIRNNHFSLNTVGLSCWSVSTTNQIIQNTFINNSENAIDKSQNHWEYNYWSDWIGLGNTRLRFVPYIIRGGALLNLDWYPIENPYDWSEMR